MSMVTFVVKNLAGKVIRSGVCDENLVALQKMNTDETIETFEPGQEPQINQDANETPIYSHAHARMGNYPDIREQLDAMWQVIAENCTMNPKAQLLYDKVMAVKDQFPKDKKYIQKGDGTFIVYNGEQ